MEAKYNFPPTAIINAKKINNKKDKIEFLAIPKKTLLNSLVKIIPTIILVYI